MINTYVVKIIDKMLISDISNYCLLSVYCSVFFNHIHSYVFIFYSQSDSYENIVWDKPYSHAAVCVTGAWLGYLLHSQQGQPVRLTRVSHLFS